MQARQDEIRQWERDWRENITGQMQDIAKMTGDTALVVREMQGDVKELMEWKEGQDKRRDDREAKGPDDRRANLSLLISTGIGLFYLITYIAAHWKP